MDYIGADSRLRNLTYRILNTSKLYNINTGELSLILIFRIMPRGARTDSLLLIPYSHQRFRARAARLARGWHSCPAMPQKQDTFFCYANDREIQRMYQKTSQ